MIKFVCSSLVVAILALGLNAESLSVSVRSDPLCPFCLEALNATVNYLKNNKSKEEILHKIELGVCLGLGALALPCYEFVKKNGPWIIDELANNTSPAALCREIKLCESNSTLSIQRKKQTEKKLVRSSHVSNRIVGDSVFCPVCLEALNATANFLKNNKSKEEILHKIELTVCLGLGPLALPCYEFVKKNGPWIIDELANNTNPILICQAIKLCDSNSTLNIKPKTEAKLVKSKQVSRLGNSTFCPLCLAFVNEIDNMLKDNKTKEQVLHTLELICLPLGGLALPCYELVKKEGLRLIDAIANNTNANVVCQSLKLCEANSTLSSKPKREVKSVDQNDAALRLGNSTFCPLCLAVVNEVGAMLKANKTKDQILHTIELACLPLGGLALPCYELIKNEGPRIIDEIANNSDPNVICQSIKLCDANLTIHIEHQTPDPAMCGVCTKLLNVTAGLLKQNKTVDEIVKEAEKLCLAIPKVSIKCYEFVKKNGAKIIDELTKNISAQVICKEFGLCASSLENKNKDQRSKVKSITCPVCLNLFALKNEKEINSIKDRVCLNSADKSSCLKSFEMNNSLAMCAHIGQC